MDHESIMVHLGCCGFVRMRLLCVCMHVSKFCLIISTVRGKDVGVCFRTEVAKLSQRSSGFSGIA